MGDGGGGERAGGGDCWAGRGGGGGEGVFGSWLRVLFARVLVARVLFIDGARAFKHKKCILERKVCAAIVANVGQKESGVVEGVEVCGWEVGMCSSGEGMGDSAGNGTVRWHV